MADCFGVAKALAVVGPRARGSDGPGGAAREPPPRSQQELIEGLVKTGAFVIEGDADASHPAVACMLGIDRAHFARPGTSSELAYAEGPLHLPHTMMSSPSAHARACAALMPSVAMGGRGSRRRALDIGAGSGYMSACLAACIADFGGDGSSLVVVLELTAELARIAVAAARHAIEQSGHPTARAAASLLVPFDGDGRQGCERHAPFDAIYVGGSCTHIPVALTRQLAPGGRLLLCVGEHDEPQDLTLVEKDRRSGELVRNVLHRGSMMYGLK